MNARKNYLLLMLLFIAFTACNKKPVRYQPYVTTFTKHCMVNGVDMVDAIFVSKKEPYNTLIYVYFRNAGSKPIDNVKIFIEMCTTMPQNYDNCPYQWTFNIGGINVNDTAGYHQLSNIPLAYVAQQFRIDSNSVNVGILNYDTLNMKTIGGNYLINNNTSIVSSSANVYGVIAKGFVFADGNSVFRYKMYNSEGTVYYNAFGNIIGDSMFNGNLLNGTGAIISTLSLGGNKSVDTAGGVLKCTFNINTPIFDTINAINVNLNKAL